MRFEVHELAPGRTRCVHCGYRTAMPGRRHGLCLSCVLVPAIREAHRPPPYTPPPRPKAITPNCRHCGREKVNRPRGLCWTCHRSPAVRALYGPVSKYGTRGVGHHGERRRLPPDPTDTPPGTPERAAVYAERCRTGCTLWHPDDATGSD
jgi:ribosomal protein S14